MTRPKPVQRVWLLCPTCGDLGEFNPGISAVCYGGHAAGAPMHPPIARVRSEPPAPRQLNSRPTTE